MIDPFADMHIDRTLVCRFFGVFARFEFAMKEVGFCAADRYGTAKPDWARFQRHIGETISASDDPVVLDAIQLLVSHPPMVQRFEGGFPVFRHASLRGDNNGESALESARRVRNNLFHGGKSMPHSPPERDEALLLAALKILGACLENHHDLRSTFDYLRS